MAHGVDLLLSTFGKRSLIVVLSEDDNILITNL